MSNKKILEWINTLPPEKEILVSTSLKKIHPIADNIVRRLLDIEAIVHVRLSETDIQASSEIQTRGRSRLPVSTPGHKSAIGVHLVLDYPYKTIQFHEITSAKKGYGEQMVKAVLTSIPEDWQALVAMDYSDGFWDRMIEKYDNLTTV